MLAGASSGGHADLNVVAMAISGFTGDDRNALWREQCRSIGASLSSPYLRTLFAFLTATSGELYDTVLVSFLKLFVVSISRLLINTGRITTAYAR